MGRKHRRVSVPRVWQYVGVAALGLVVAGMVWQAFQPVTPPVASERATWSAEDFAKPAPPSAVAFGDSWFNGADGIHEDGAFGYLALTGLGYQTVVGGHGGTGYAKAEPIENGAPNYVGQIEAGGLNLSRDPEGVDLVVLEGGINDFSEPADAVGVNAASVIQSVQTTFPNARVVVLGPPHIEVGSKRKQAVTDAIASAAAQAGVEFIDMAQWVTPENVDSIIGDVSTHPDREGFQLLADMLTEALVSIGVEPVPAT